MWAAAEASCSARATGTPTRRWTSRTGPSWRASRAGSTGTRRLSPAGSVIHPVAGFSGPGVLNLSAVSGVRIRELAILNDMGSPANVDGISCHGNVNGLEILHVSVAWVSGYGLAYYQSAGVDGDGLWMSRCMFQRTGKSAVHRPVNDANIHNVHIQYAGDVAGPADGHGFFSDAGSAGNMTYVGCRADLCRGQRLADRPQGHLRGRHQARRLLDRAQRPGRRPDHQFLRGRHRLAVPGHHQRMLLRGRRDEPGPAGDPGHRGRVRRHPGPGTEPGVHRRHHRGGQHHRRDNRRGARSTRWGSARSGRRPAGRRRSSGPAGG